MVKLAMVDAAETSAYPIGLMTYTQAPALHEKTFFTYIISLNQWKLFYLPIYFGFPKETPEL